MLYKIKLCTEYAPKTSRGSDIKPNIVPNAPICYLEQPSVTLGDGVLRRESGRHGPVDDPEPVEAVRVLRRGHVSRAFLSARSKTKKTSKFSKHQKEKTKIKQI